MYTPPPLSKVIPFPLLFASGLAVTIAWIAPELGPFAYVSAWVGSFGVLTIWSILLYHRKQSDD
jgi:hypothetical protein